MNRKTARMPVIVLLGLLTAVLLSLAFPRPDQLPALVSVVASTDPASPIPSGPPLPVKPEDFWAENWRELNTTPRSAERDTHRADFLEKLASVDPQRALALAAAEADPALRDPLLQAALRGWGSAAPEAALAWARSQSLLDHGLAIASVFHGAVAEPADSLQLVARLSLAEPERAQDYSRYLVAAFSQSGRSELAADFAAAAPLENCTDLVMDAYARWAQTDPHAALTSAGRLPEARAQEGATNAVLSRWADNDPAAAADFALGLHSESARRFAFAVALPAWAGKDPAAARTWISQFDPSVELDTGMAAVATNPLVLKQPESAMIWAESIVDSKLRLRVLATVLNQWAVNDPAAARRYAASIEEVSSEDREELFRAFSSSFEPLSLLP